MRTRRTIARYAGVLLFAFLLFSVASASPVGYSVATPETPAHATNAVAAIAASVSPAMPALPSPSHRALFGALLAYVVAALSVALVRTSQSRAGLSPRALLVRAGLGRRGRSPPYVRS